MEGHESDSQLAKFLARQKRHPLILAEHNHFAVLLDGELGENLAKLLELWRMVGLLIEKKSRIAQHAHVLNAAQNPLLIDVGKPALALPLAHQLRQISLCSK